MPAPVSGGGGPLLVRRVDYPASAARRARELGDQAGREGEAAAAGLALRRLAAEEDRAVVGHVRPLEEQDFRSPEARVPSQHGERVQPGGARVVVSAREHGGVCLCPRRGDRARRPLLPRRDAARGLLKPPPVRAFPQPLPRQADGLRALGHRGSAPASGEKPRLETDDRITVQRRDGQGLDGRAPLRHEVA